MINYYILKTQILNTYSKTNITFFLLLLLDIPRFNALCRGEELRPLSYVAKLKCYLKHNNDPFYRLNPFKEEVAHLEPGIWVYHDVASTIDTEAIRNTAAPFVS